MYKDKKAIKRDILAHFRKSEVIRPIPRRWLEIIYLNDFSPFERKSFAQAMEELAENGIIEPRGLVRGAIRLTEKGVALIQ